METKFLNYLTAGLIASGGVTIAPSLTVAQTIPSPGAEVEHLTCVKDAQGLMCKADERDNTPTAQDEAATLKLSAPPQIMSSEQLGRVSNLLLGCLYFVLPTGLALAIFLHDKRSKLFSEQVARLEKLWSQNPQH